MKQSLLVFLLIHALLFQTSAQNSFGLKAGLNLANQDKTVPTNFIPAELTLNTKAFFGYQIGTFYKLQLAQKWQLAIEPALSLIGSKTQYTTDSNLFDPKEHFYNDKVSYIDMPLTIQYGRQRFYVGLGPGIAFRIGSRITDFEDRTFKTSSYKATDISANAIIGYKICNNVDVNFRYSQGLSNALKESTGAEAKNRFFNFTVLYSLHD